MKTSAASATTEEQAERGELPEGWEFTTLGDLITPSKEKVDPKQCPNASYLSLEHVESNTTKVLGRGLAQEVKSTKTVFRAGDVLYGKLRPYLNKVCIPEFNGVCSTDFLVFEQTSWLQNRLLLRFLTRPEVVEIANHHSTGVELPRVNFDVLAKLTLPLPPLAEQSRIISKTEELVALVHASQDRLASVPKILKAFRQSVLAAACSGRLTQDWREKHQDIESATKFLVRIRELREKRSISSKSRSTLSEDKQFKEAEFYELPDSWVWCKVGDMATVGLGGTPSRKQLAYWGGKIPWVSSGEVANRRITNTAETITHQGLANSNAKVYPTGTVLIAMIGEGKTRGQSAILDIEACTNQNVAGLKFDGSQMISEYVWYWALGEYERTRAVGRGGNQPALNGEKVRNLPFPLPPTAEQQEIVRRVDALFKLADKIDERVSAAAKRADKLTQAILAKAFRGELVPTEAELARQEGRDYEPASVLLSRIKADREQQKVPHNRAERQASARRG